MEMKAQRAVVLAVLKKRGAHKADEAALIPTHPKSGTRTRISVVLAETSVCLYVCSGIMYCYVSG